MISHHHSRHSLTADPASEDSLPMSLVWGWPSWRCGHLHPWARLENLGSWCRSMLPCPCLGLITLYCKKKMGGFLNLLGHNIHIFCVTAVTSSIYNVFWSLWICKSCFGTTSMFTSRGCTGGEVQAQYRLASRIFEAYIHHFISFQWTSSQRPRGLFVLPRYWATCTANERYGLNMTLPSQSAFPGFALYISSPQHLHLSVATLRAPHPRFHHGCSCACNEAGRYGQKHT